jgi:hypothetical protein
MGAAAQRVREGIGYMGYVGKTGSSKGGRGGKEGEGKGRREGQTSFSVLLSNEGARLRCCVFGGCASGDEKFAFAAWGKVVSFTASQPQSSSLFESGAGIAAAKPGVESLRQSTTA